jgi:hypothetical protein
MNYPKINVAGDTNSHLLFKTYKIGFDIIGNKYEFDIQVSIGTDKENKVYADILDILNVYLNGEAKDRPQHNILLSNITTMFGSEWYENAVKEQALKDWEQISFEGKTEEIDLSSILDEIKSDLENFDYEDYLDIDTENSYDRSIKVVPTIDESNIADELYLQIERTIKNHQ